MVAMDLETAARELEVAGSLCDPVSDPALAARVAQRKAHFFVIRGVQHEAIAWARRAGELVPHDPMTAWALGMALGFAAEFAQARAVLERSRGQGTVQGLPVDALRGWVMLHTDELAPARRTLAPAAAGSLRVGLVSLGG